MDITFLLMQWYSEVVCFQDCLVGFNSDLKHRRRGRKRTQPEVNFRELVDVRMRGSSSSSWRFCREQGKVEFSFW